MAEYGDDSGTVLPVKLPKISDIAHIQQGLRNLYYGTPSEVDVVSEGDIPLKSIAGRIIAVRDSKLDKVSGVADNQITISHASLPKLILSRGGNLTTIQKSDGGAVTITLPSASGTLALITESTLLRLGNIGTGTNPGDQVGTLTLGSQYTDTYSIATTVRSGNRAVNIATAADTGTKTINIGTGSTASTTTVTIGTNSGGTSNINTRGTLTHAGNSSFTGTLAVTGSATVSSSLNVTGQLSGGYLMAGPTVISAGSGTPSGGSQGDMYLRSGQSHASTLYLRSVDGWNTVRGSKWFVGTTDAPSLSGSQVGDFYLNRINGKIFQVT